MLLSKRLETIANMVDQDDIVLDIGTDHGYLPIYLVSNQIIKLAVASDIKESPLKMALKNVDKANLKDKIKLVLSDGLEAITSYFNTLVIAGVGPRTIINVLNKGKNKIKGKTLILQSNVSSNLVREWLVSNNFKIIDEALVHEDNNYYEIIKAVNGKQILTSSDLYLGPFIKKIKNETVINYFNLMHDKYSKLIKRIPKKEIEKVKKIEEIIEIYKKRISRFFILFFCSLGLHLFRSIYQLFVLLERVE
jgi:tRNA (adenine22-N1)-methyltransferase